MSGRSNAGGWEPQGLGETGGRHKAARRYRKPVFLPDHVGADDLGRIGSFLLEQVDLTTGYTTIEADDGEISGGLFSEAWSEVRPGDRLLRVVSAMWNDDVSVLLEWRAATDRVGPPSQMTVVGASETLVLGLAEATRLFVERTMTGPWLSPTQRPPHPDDGAVARPQPRLGNRRPWARPPDDRRSQDHSRRRRLLSWARDLSVTVVGGLLVAALLSLASILLVILR